MLFRGIIEGEGALWRVVDTGVSGWGVGGVNGIGGRFGIIDIRLSRRASVGLIVRAARPVACTLFGMIENRFSEEGVPMSLPRLLPGDLAVPATEEIAWSGELDIATA